MEKQGIYYQKSPSGSEFFAQMETDQSENLFVQVYKDVEILHHNYFTISVNAYLGINEEISRIFHELAHLFSAYRGSTLGDIRTRRHGHRPVRDSVVSRRQRPSCGSLCCTPSRLL